MTKYLKKEEEMNYYLTEEEKKRVAEFFLLLMKIDQRLKKEKEFLPHYCGDYDPDIIEPSEDNPKILVPLNRRN